MDYEEKMDAAAGTDVEIIVAKLQDPDSGGLTSQEKKIIVEKLLGGEGGLTPEERKIIIDKLCDLFTMRSGIALAITVAFCFVVFKGLVGPDDLKTIFMMILAWYFGVEQGKKENG